MKPNDQAGEVYVVQAQTVGLIKIGLAVHAESRLKDLQLSGPDRLRVLSIIPTADPQALERRLHSFFGWLRVHGEWFRPAPVLVHNKAHIELSDAKRVEACQAFLDNLLLRHGGKRKTIGDDAMVAHDMPPFWPGGPEEESARNWGVL